MPEPATRSVDRLLSVLKGAIKHGDFTLASGAKSTWYLDCRPVTFSWPSLVANAFLDTLPDEMLVPATIVGGPAVGAIPIAVALGMDYGIRTFAVRPKPKDHGADLESLVIGDVRAGDRALVVEDVVTSGGSVARACSEVVKAGAEVIGVACLLKRGAPSETFAFEDPNAEPMHTEDHYNGDGMIVVPFFHLFTIADLGLS